MGDQTILYLQEGPGIDRPYASQRLVGHQASGHRLYGIVLDHDIIVVGLISYHDWIKIIRYAS